MDAAHNLKSTGGYVAASRIHYAGYYIQKAFHDDDQKTMIEFYPQAIESCLEFLVESRRLL